MNADAILVLVMGGAGLGLILAAIFFCGYAFGFALARAVWQRWRRSRRRS